MTTPRPTRAPAEEQAPQPSALLQRSLRMQLRIFLLLFVVMLAISIWHVVDDGVSPLWLLAGLLPGMALGVALARTKVLGWDADAQSVVARSDALGITILVAYLIFVLLLRGELIGVWVHSAAAASVVSLSMTAGTMLSRVASTTRGIRNALVTAGIPLPPRRGHHR